MLERVKSSHRANIIVGFTPFHSIFMERLIDTLDGENFCLFTKKWPRPKNNCTRLGVFADKGCIRKISYLVSFLCFTLIVRYLFLTGRDVYVYVPHPSNIFSNFLFFSSRVKSVNLYEDGLLNYYDIEASGDEVGLGLKLFSTLCGVPFRAYHGHLAGYDARKVHNLYVTRGNEVVGKDKIESIVQLQSAEISTDTVPGRVLFLDQNVSPLVPMKRRQALIAKMFETYPIENYHYIYKGHHDYQYSIEGMSTLQSDLSQLPAEMLVPEVKPELVVSFFSSALLNISIAFPNVKCVALAAEGIQICRDGVPGSLADIFSANGVHCFRFE